MACFLRACSISRVNVSIFLAYSSCRPTSGLGSTCPLNVISRCCFGVRAGTVIASCSFCNRAISASHCWSSRGVFVSDFASLSFASLKAASACSSASDLLFLPKPSVNIFLLNTQLNSLLKLRTPKTTNSSVIFLKTLIEKLFFIHICLRNQFFKKLEQMIY